MVTGITSYVLGCVLFYFLWYKNGLFLHYSIIILVIGGIGLFTAKFKEDKVVFKKDSSNKTLLIIIFIVVFTFGFGMINALEKKWVNSILKLGPTKQVVATVVDIDLRSTRTGKQPWSIINYYAEKQLVEQAFADTSKGLIRGKKYLIEYAIEYPDMFRVVKALK
jgi:hypothetical protein